MMRYQTILPRPSLRPYVRLFWTMESEATAAAPYIHRSMADGCLEILFHYKGPFTELCANGETLPQGLSLIHAQSSHHRRFLTTENFSILGLYLYPFALPLLSGHPATAISNLMPALEDVFGRDGHLLEEQVMDAADNRQRILLISNWLEKRLYARHKPDRGIFTAISEVIHSGTQQPISQLAAQYCLSMRQFQRRFTEYAGFSPRLYQRIVRFQAALARYPNRDASLTQVAYDCGYYDQSHFIHDFKAFSGYHPGTYFSGKAEGTEWRTA